MSKLFFLVFVMFNILFRIVDDRASIYGSMGLVCHLNLTFMKTICIVNLFSIVDTRITFLMLERWWLVNISMFSYRVMLIFYYF